MSFLDGYHCNFESVQQASERGVLALIECTEKETGKKVAVIAAVFVDEDGLYNLVPYARMIEGNPYDQLDPPLTRKEKR